MHSCGEEFFSGLIISHSKGNNNVMSVKAVTTCSCAEAYVNGTQIIVHLTVSLLLFCW